MRSALFLTTLATAAAQPHTKSRPNSQPTAPQPVVDDVVGARALLLPDEEGHRLALQNKTLTWLRSIPGPIAVVTAIGQYRSGKSYLLNQLMEVPCDRGFGVGHKRETQTKGVWAYAVPGSNSSSSSVTRLYFDTEGFDATGKAEVYDDRIFAFSALASSALLYNLVETIKEADIEKLAFVAQLATEFWRRTHNNGRESDSRRVLSEKQKQLLHAEEKQQQQKQQQQQHEQQLHEHGGGGGGGGGHRHASDWTPPALLWLVQRDFLQGSTVNDYLRQALQPVPHQPSDQHGERLNAIRASLAAFDGLGGGGSSSGNALGGGGLGGGGGGNAGNPLGGMAGMGLVQPHVRRTELCELSPSDLAPEYLAGMRKVRGWVAQHASGKGSGRVWRSGTELATQVSQLVNVLNAQRIPTAGSVIDAFNRELVTRTLIELRGSLGRIVLPLDADALRVACDDVIGSAKLTLRSDGFGAVAASGVSGSAGAEFESGTKAAVLAVEGQNFRASHELCKTLWDVCSASLEKLKAVTLPSRRRFKARLNECNTTLAACVGPASSEMRERLSDAAARGATEYGDAFLQRISHLLVITCVGGILLFRYILKNGLAELLCWLLLVSAEILPRMNAIATFNPLKPDQAQLSSSAFWETPTGSMLLEGYEVFVYNEYADADDWVQIALIGLISLLVARQCYISCKECCCCDDGSGSGGGGGDRRERRRRSRRDGGSRGGGRRAHAMPRRMQAFSDDDDDDGSSLLEDGDWVPGSRSNMPLRGKKKRSSGGGLFDW